MPLAPPTAISVPLPLGTHFGDVGIRRKLGPLMVAESRYAPRSCTPLHCHETASFTLTLTGSYVEEFPRTRLECSSGSVLFRPSQEVHRDRIGPAGAHCLMLEMPADWLRRMATRGLRLEAPRQARDHHRFASRIQRELFLADDLAAIALEALAIELACDLERHADQGSHAPRWLSRLRERIDAEYRDLAGLSALAADAGVHPAHLARAFRRHFGSTVGEYARRRRIEFAREQLCRSASSLTEIAAAAGFASQAHFTRLFRLHVGMTPGEFRRLALARCKSRARMSRA